MPKVKYGQALVKEVLYSEQYCYICGDFKETAELLIDTHYDGIIYVAMCKKCLKKLLKDFSIK